MTFLFTTWVSLISSSILERTFEIRINCCTTLSHSRSCSLEYFFQYTNGVVWIIPNMIGTLSSCIHSKCRYCLKICPRLKYLTFKNGCGGSVSSLFIDKLLDINHSWDRKSHFSLRICLLVQCSCSIHPWQYETANWTLWTLQNKERAWSCGGDDLRYPRSS